MNDFLKLSVMIGATLLVGAAAVTILPKPADPLADYLKAHACSIQSRAETGRSIYCGKACWHREIETVYKCANGLRVVRT